MRKSPPSEPASPPQSVRDAAARAAAGLPPYSVQAALLNGGFTRDAIASGEWRLSATVDGWAILARRRQ